MSSSRSCWFVTIVMKFPQYQETLAISKTLVHKPQMTKKEKTWDASFRQLVLEQHKTSFTLLAPWYEVCVMFNSVCVERGMSVSKTFTANKWTTHHNFCSVFLHHVLPPALSTHSPGVQLFVVCKKLGSMVVRYRDLTLWLLERKKTCISVLTTMWYSRLEHTICKAPTLLKRRRKTLGCTFSYSYGHMFQDLLHLEGILIRILKELYRLLSQQSNSW